MRVKHFSREMIGLNLDQWGEMGNCSSKDEDRDRHGPPDRAKIKLEGHLPIEVVLTKTLNWDEIIVDTPQLDEEVDWFEIVAVVKQLVDWKLYARTELEAITVLALDPRDLEHELKIRHLSPLLAKRVGELQKRGRVAIAPLRVGEPEPGEPTEPERIRSDHVKHRPIRVGRNNSVDSP